MVGGGWWTRQICYIRFGIPDAWFLGYQFTPGTPPDRNLVICLIPPFALVLNLGALHHRLTCAVCYRERWRFNFWVR
jgi:hypothetical protein